MAISIRSATLHDILPITQSFQAAFDEKIDSQQIKTCFQRQTHFSYVAISGETVVGFVDGFLTIAHNGKKRLELDLLAVHPASQGQGVGTKLITHFCNNAPKVDFIRALVAVGNHPMDKVMTKTNFQPLPDNYALYIGQPTAQTAPKPKNAHFVTVETLSYNGIWLEEDITQEAIDAATPQHPVAILGAVVPTTDDTTIQSIKSANFAFIKQFRWWHYIPA